MRNNYQIWKVRYWNHPRGVNDCRGNTRLWTGKARTKDEAIRKARIENQTNGVYDFRVHSAKLNEEVAE